MKTRSLMLALPLALATASSPAAPASPPPHPRMEFTSLLFLFPWLGPAAEMLDPIDINAIDILFDTIEDPDAFDNPPAHG
jgi:hypothetical protein